MKRVVALLALAVVAGCTPTTTPPPSPSTARTSATSTPTQMPSPSVTPTLEEQFADLDKVVLTEPTTLGPAWSELFTLPYGDAPEQLGTSLGGDGEGLQWGPSYGTQLPDGTWWFLDTAHTRLAHYSETGDYLGEAPIPKKHLAGGEYVQYAVPLALSDGTVVLQGTTPDEPAMLLLAPDGAFKRVKLPEFVAAKSADGAYLYGFNEKNKPVRIDPHTGKLTQVEGFTGQGVEYKLTVAKGRVDLTLPDAAVDLPVVAEGRESSVVYFGVEAAPGSDGVMNLLVNGTVEDTPGEIADFTGFVRIAPDGRGLVESLRPLTSESDPADGLRLGVRLGDSRPWLMVIDSDAVRVYRRG